MSRTPQRSRTKRGARPQLNRQQKEQRSRRRLWRSRKNRRSTRKATLRRFGFEHLEQRELLDGVGLQIIDNGDIGYATTGAWTQLTGQGYLSDTNRALAGTGDSAATWTFNVSPAARYRVWATWNAAGNRATDAPFTILDGATPRATILVNQELSPADLTSDGGVWKQLGDSHAVVGSTLVVQLTNQANEYVFADAVRIERVGDLSAPTAGITGPTSGVRGQARLFSISANDPVDGSPGQLYSYTVQWGDGESVTLANQPAQLQLEHVFTASGTYNVSVTAIDADGMTSAPTTHNVTIAGAALDGGDLIVGGTLGADTIQLTPAAGTGNVDVTVNGQSLGTFQPTSRIFVFGQAGNDDIQLQTLSLSAAITTVLDGGEGNDTISGSNSRDTILGGAGDDQLGGLGGNDTLEGQAGNDLLDGGAGNDTFQFDADGALGSDTVVEAKNGGTDTLFFYATSTQGVTLDLSRTLPQTVNANLTLTLSASDTFETIIGSRLADSLTGNGLNNNLSGGTGDDTLSGGGGSDTLNGGEGNDLLIGGAGNDVYVLDTDVQLGLVMIDEAGGGVDTLDFSATTTMAVQVDLGLDTVQVVNTNLSLQLLQATGIENVVGSNCVATGDVLIGNGLANRLEGGAGNDTLTGGAGNDTYAFDADSQLGVDRIEELADGGTDTLDCYATSTVGVTLDLSRADQQTVNANLGLVLSGDSVLENAIGSRRDDTLTGNALANMLSGGTGNDTLGGGVGNDVLNGGEGNDLMVGGAGDDAYVLDADVQLGTDTIDESGGGLDTLDFSATTTVAVQMNLGVTTVQTVNANLSLQLLQALGIENAIGSNCVATGDILTGNSLANRLEGGAGNDTLTGGAGNDTYAFDADTVLGVDTVVELAGGGVDMLDFYATSTMGVTVDLASTSQQTINANLALVLSAADVLENAIGSRLADTLTGNGLANMLSGGTGNDTLNGGAGNDTLNGGDGDNQLVGGAGNDTYILDADSVIHTDTIDEVGGGVDTLDFSSTTTVGVTVDLSVTAIQSVNANQLLRLLQGNSIENVLGGNCATEGDVLRGNSSGNQLTGNAGDDTLIGNGGNDTYFFDADSPLGSDTVIEQAGGGTDILYFYDTSTLAVTVDLSSTQTQSVNANLQLTLSSGDVIETVVGSRLSDTLLGNALSNTLSGGIGNDTLLGGAGNDTLNGGAGDDTYLLDADVQLSTETIDESGGGIDTLDFSATTTKSIRVDLLRTTTQAVATSTLQLVLLSDSAIENVIGGAFSDVVIGNALANNLRGGGGNDVLVGAGGADVLIGEAGRDILVGGSGGDELRGGAGEDVLIGGRTSYHTESTGEVNYAALDALAAEWARTNAAFITRVRNLRDGTGLNSPYCLNADTTADDGAVDQMYGDAERDWVLANPAERADAADNSAPAALGDSYTVNQGATLTVPAAGVLANDTDADGDPLTAVLLSGPVHGTLTLSADGSFSYTPNEGYSGSDSFSYRADDGVELSSAVTVSIMVNPLNVVYITAAWLAAQGAGPYVLSQANTTYVLQTDVTTDGTAFVVGEANVTLDLNGHTVTYGNAAPITVPNGGFETGSGRNVPGWDLTAAPSAAIASNTMYMWGNQVLTFSNMTGTQSILSDAIFLPTGGWEYAATITPKGPSDATVKLSVIDAVTQEVLASANSSAVERGFAAVVQFVPAAATSVRLKVEITAAAGKTQTISLDYASLTPSRDYGISATPSSYLWPDQLKSNTTAYNAARKAKNFTLRNGAIVQGQARSYKGFAVNAQSLSGLNVDGVQVQVSGIDAQSVFAQWASDTLVVQNSTFRSATDKVTNRMHQGAMISFDSIKGSVSIHNNQILDHPKSGIEVVGGTGHTISHNTIDSNAIVTNCYGILMAGVQNSQVHDNTITTTRSGRGILLDGLTGNTQDSVNVEIFNNMVDVRERSNLEYPQGGLEATALRLRSYRDAGHRQLNIHDNTFIARTGVGYAYGAIGVRVSYLDNTSGVEWGNVLSNNTFRAIVETANSTYWGRAVTLEGVKPGTDLMFVGNVLESNHISLAFGGNDGAYAHDTSFISTTFRKSTEGAARSYQTIRAGDNNGDVSGIQLIDNRYEGGASEVVTLVGTGSKEISLGWLLDVQVRNAASQPLSGAQVTLRDKGGNQVFAGQTDADGKIGGIRVVTKIVRQAGTNPSTTDLRSPHELTVSLTGYQTLQQPITLESSTSLSLTLLSDGG